ncbi:MAG: EFR1 family ferrodoxin [Paludibacteraceae bacterium]|nr:EFR1 family ferrodoxin [Paludibacteraceae bacterium]
MILYFSGTGNSLAIARKIAEGIGEQVLSMYDAVKADLSGEKRIGLVFPTYNLDAPIAVTQLIPRIRFPKDAYTFVVITCGAQTNNAVWTVRRLLKQQGVRVDYCHKIRVPDSSALAFGRNPNDQAWKFGKFAPRLETIIAELAAEKHRLHFAGFDPFGWLMSRENLQRKIAQMTTPQVNPDKCIGCNTCVRVCPQRNIILLENTDRYADGVQNTDKPLAAIGPHCTWCLSCVHFCPQQAVEVNGKTVSKAFQYHHPDIRLKDMLKR